MNSFLKKMETDTTQNLYIINENFLNIEYVKKIINPNTSIICFDESFSIDNPLIQILDQKIIDKLIIIGNAKNIIKMKRLFIRKYVSKSILEHVKNELLVIISSTNIFDKAKNIINQLIKLEKICYTLNINLKISINNSYILGYIYGKNSIFTPDFINTLYALSIKDQKSKYEFIYDITCKYLDDQFIQNNYCDFKNNQCFANRNNSTAHCDMGCCYSFEYASFFEPTFIKNTHLCKYLKNKTCSTYCIACKLFTCKALRKKNIHFEINKYLLLNCFFDSKQHLILKHNFFKTKEEILVKLLEKNNTPYFIYYITNKYRI